MLNRIKVDNDCVYTAGETDPWGDAYVPDTRNIMSYSRVSCRDNFSEGQIEVMEASIAYNNARKYILQYNTLFTSEPDQFEPDDDPLPGIPRPIHIGETQCHTFHEIWETCKDPVDWLELITEDQEGNTSGTIGKYVVEVTETIPEVAFPVASLSFYEIDPMTKIIGGQVTAALRSQSPTKIVYELPCDIENLYIEVVKTTSSDDVGDYLISVEIEEDERVYIETDDLCIGNSLFVQGVPFDLKGEIVNWESSSTIQLSTTQGSSTTINSFTPDADAYWVRAIITYAGCTKIIREFLEAPLDENFQIRIVEDAPPCLDGAGHVLPGEYHIEPPMDVEWSISEGTVQPGNGSSVQVFTPSRTTGTFELKAELNGVGCDNTTIVEFFDVVVDVCGFEKKITVNPNPAVSTISLNILPTFTVAEEVFGVTIINRFSSTLYQQNINQRSHQVDVSQFPDDIYSIIVSSAEEVETISFVISRE